MSRALELRNRQRERKIRLPELKKVVQKFLDEFVPDKQCELGIYLVGAAEIQQFNETWLRHRGTTDVITFDYNDPALPRLLAGEIFVCVPQAVAQARQFNTTWQSEVVRYVIHGILHLRGLDDRTATKGRAMKNIENHWMKVLASEFEFRRIGPGSTRVRR